MKRGKLKRHNGINNCTAGAGYGIAAFRTARNIRRAAMTHVLKLPLGFFTGNQSGRLRKLIDDNAGPVSYTHLKAQNYLDECERGEVERRFSLAKRKCGMGLVTAKLQETAADVYKRQLLDIGKLDENTLRHAGIASEILMTLPTLESASVDELLSDRKSTRLNSSHRSLSRMPSSA